MRLPQGLSCFVPALPRLGLRVEGTRLSLRPHSDPQTLSSCLRFCNQLFFASVSGSTTVTTPLVRLRPACPVSPQLRVRLPCRPASGHTAQIVSMLTRPQRSGALLAT